MRSARKLAVLAFLGSAVVAPVAQAATPIDFVPGTSGTTPGGKSDVGNDYLDWLDNGIYTGDPTTCLCDSNVYPAALGLGVGQDSFDKGIAAFVALSLAHDPNVQEDAVGGSQGSDVIWRALSSGQLNGRKIHAVLYSNPDTPDTGIAQAFPGPFPASMDPFVILTGVTPGAVPAPNDPNFQVVSVSHQWDPMAYFPKTILFWPVSLPVAVLGFAVDHGDLGNIDYTNAQVTQVNGSTTLIKIMDPQTPVGKALTLVVNQVAGAQAAATVAAAFQPVDDVLGGFFHLGGQDAKGQVSFLPSASDAQTEAQGFVNGFVKAAQDLTALPQTLFAPPKQTATSPLVTNTLASTPAPAPQSTAATVPAATTAPSPLSATLTKAQTAKVVSTPTPVAAVQAPSPAAAPATTSVVSKPKVKAPASNPVTDTIKTVQGAITKALTPPKVTAPKAPAAEKPQVKAAPAAAEKHGK